jgi:hypothetical protein
MQRPGHVFRNIIKPVFQILPLNAVDKILQKLRNATIVYRGKNALLCSLRIDARNAAVGRRKKFSAEVQNERMSKQYHTNHVN